MLCPRQALSLRYKIVNNDAYLSQPEGSPRGGVQLAGLGHLHSYLPSGGGILGRVQVHRMPSEFCMQEYPSEELLRNGVKV